MDKLIFLSNELLSPTLQRKMNLPLLFINFGIIEAKMYSHFGKRSTFTYIGENKWGNRKVYGALFLCKDFDFYARIIDAYHICSLTTLYKNHTLDLHHRVTVEVTPLYFSTLEELASLKYREGEPILAETYVANPNHPKIRQRVESKKNSYRIYDGIDVKYFKELFWGIRKC